MRGVRGFGDPHPVIGAGHQIATALPDPGKYDLSLHGPNGFFRHFAGSHKATLRVKEQAADRAGTLTLEIVDDYRRPVTVHLADAYGTGRHLKVHGTAEITIETRHSGGWYDIALTTPSDASFRYELAGRLESRFRLTSDPQLGR